MIYTCTTNPSLDYYISLQELKMGQNNRSDMEMYEAGGKGVNVSIVLSNFQITSSCLGFLGGFTKDFYISKIATYPNIQPLFTTIKDNTRINVKLMDNQYETGLNAIGPHISEEEFSKFESRLFNIFAGDVFVLSGSIEDEIEDKMADIIKQLSIDGVKIVLDTEPQFMDKCFEYKPYLVKLNDAYLDYEKKDLDELAKGIIAKGVKYVLYSAAHKPSFLYTDDQIFECDNLDDGLVNTTGSADSMVAGFLYGTIRGANPFECFKYANAATISTSMSNDTDSKYRLEEAFNTIEVKTL